MDDEKFAREIILDIYDTTLAPETWPIVLDKVSHFVGAVGALIIDLTDSPKGRILQAKQYTSNYDEETANAYFSLHRAQELEDQKIFADLSKRTDEIELIGDEVLAVDRETLELRDNVKFMRSIGLTFRAAALLNKDLTDNDRFAFQFDKQQGRLNSEHIDKSALLLPHIAKALNVGRPTAALAAKSAIVIEGLNQLKSGVCIVDSHQNVIVKNIEFERQLDAYDVFQVSVDGRLKFNNAGIMKTASEMFSGVGFHGRFGARPRKEALNSAIDGKLHDLCIEIIPLDNTNSIDQKLKGGSFVFSLDTSQNPDIDAKLIAENYQLTNSEQQVFGFLAEGLTNPEIADRCGKSVETVNTQVKSILSKTMSPNRTQLIRLASQTGSVLIR